jgi:hypothetical protein
MTPVAPALQPFRVCRRAAVLFSVVASPCTLAAACGASSATKASPDSGPLDANCSGADARADGSPDSGARDADATGTCEMANGTSPDALATVC